MPLHRPQLSITLPKDFIFHYEDGEVPKTPDQEDKTPPAAPSPPHPYKLKRRNRPAIHTLTQTQERLTQQLQDARIPAIETPTSIGQESIRPSVQHWATEPTGVLVAPSAIRPFMTVPRPRTPTMQRVLLSDQYRCTTPPPKNAGDAIIRPLSRCSMTSDSSDESSGSLTSYPSMGGSCTSPESDAADPFVMSSMPKLPKLSALSQPKLGLKSNSPAVTGGSNNTSSTSRKRSSVHWTPEMDKHLWSTYTQYLQDPTVTPFKTLPGSVPPLGVCHRVARLARRTWRGGQQASRANVGGSGVKTSSTDSPEAAASIRSGSSTPTGPPFATTTIWPKSSSSTRRRLRLLVKKKPTIAPHYQRLLHNPSSFAPSSQSRRARASSPLVQEQTAFNTRDIQMSLTTTTAASMQPDGPLARLSHVTQATQQDIQFSDPPVPWASPPPVPSSVLPSSIIPSSDIGHEDVHLDPGTATGLPELGSPFGGSHTWGPSRSRHQVRPSTPPRTLSSQVASTIGPTLKSPVRFTSRDPYPTVNKRRAQHQLEDELSPGGSDKQNLIDQLFSDHTEGRHRRVRSRGFSLGDVDGSNRLESLFQQAEMEGQPDVEQQTPRASPPCAESSILQLPNPGESIRRLGSPFSVSGGRSMPTRGPSRHLASSSLSAFDPGNFASIDQRIRGADLGDDFLRKLRE
ncbi:MAG: hypothetical protein L6R39_003278 [Caloplaca ligustica]|nr:MAG: hypothetical protein L6R39_003278 [Caloplaca ligustica]